MGNESGPHVYGNYGPKFTLVNRFRLLYAAVMINMDQIQELARQIEREFSPRQIVLFGSHAFGSAAADSDVDLLIVMNHKGKGWKTATKIRQRLRPQFPIDLLVRSPEEIRQRLSLGDCFIKEICTKGRILYEAPHE